MSFCLRIVSLNPVKQILSHTRIALWVFNSNFPTSTCPFSPSPAHDAWLFYLIWWVTAMVLLGVLGPVVRGPRISSNPRLNFNQGTFFFVQSIFSDNFPYSIQNIRSSNCRLKDLNLKLLFTLSFLDSNFAWLTKGYNYANIEQPGLGWLCKDLLNWGMLSQ